MEIKETKNKIEENLIIPKNLNTYLGQKGYTILKKEIDIKIEDFIRTQLTIKPFTLNNINNNNQKVYPAYRESNNKFYVPRYFGEEYFGLPKIIKITGIKIQTTSILTNPNPGIDIEKNIRNANKNNPIIKRIVAVITNEVFIFYTSS